jgi:hypothetical protein
MLMLSADDLKSLGHAKTPCACTCPLRPCAGWESFTEDRWPKAQMQRAGTLRDEAVYQPGTEEHHPKGTRYASVDAPIAVKFYPYNLCDVFTCGQCSKVVLRYTEFGGYYVDHRVRELDVNLVI